jgi:hypothetical protein
VATASYLETIGISKQLRLRYQKSQWIELLSRGAFKKFGDNISWQGGVYALQKQTALNIYPGALTAIALQGGAHYVRMGRERLYLFAPPHTLLPSWFKNYEWGVDTKFHCGSLVPTDLGFNDYKVKEFKIKISSLERAILECLYLAPDKVDLVECYQIMEGLTTLRPALLQELLEGCASIKVTRLFLYMAEKANHAWFKYLDKEKFDIGKGDRSIVKNGVYIASHKITVPKELAEYE